MFENEDNLTINDVVSICSTAKHESIEFRIFDSFNSKTIDFVSKYGLTGNNVVEI